jgi:hypothetical protein
MSVADQVLPATPDEIVKSLPPPPKNLSGKESVVVSALVGAWIKDCAGICAVAELTQEQVDNVFLGWLKRSRTANYTDVVIHHMVKKLIRTPRPKRTSQANEEQRARTVISSAAKLRGPLAVIAGTKIVEAGELAGDTNMTLIETWKSRGQKPRTIIDEIMEDISRQLLLVDNASKPVPTSNGPDHDVL